MSQHELVLGETALDFWSTEVVGFLYVLLFLYAATRVLCAAPGQTALYKYYTRLVMAGALLRSVYFCVPWSAFAATFQPSNTATFSLGWWSTLVSFLGLLSVANALFYSTFVILVYYWSQVCDDANALGKKLFWTLGVTYAAFHIFIAIFFVSCDFMLVLFVYSIMAGSFALVMVCLYTWYAARLVRLLLPKRAHRVVMSSPRKSGSRSSFVELSSTDGTPFLTQPVSPQIKDRIRRVSIVAAFVDVGFLGRSTLLGYQAYVTYFNWRAAEAGVAPEVHFPSWWWLYIALFYVVNEVLCTAGVLMLMNPRPVVKKALQHVSYASSGPGTATGVFSDL